MTERLINSLHALAGMKHPSVAEILRRRGFGYEAGKIEEIIDAWHEQPPEEPARVARHARTEGVRGLRGSLSESGRPSSSLLETAALFAAA